MTLPNPDMETFKKHILILLLLTPITLLAQSTEYVDILTIEVWQDDTIHHINSTGEIRPSITIIETKNNQDAVILSLPSPSYFERDKDWVNDFKVLYIKNDKTSVFGKIHGESFGVPKGDWVSSLVYLPPKDLKKKDVFKIKIQARSNPERIAIFKEREIEKKERDNKANAMIKHVPFTKNTVGELFDFKVNLHDGETFDSKEHRGKVILIDFWSWNCGPCQRVIPKFIELKKNFSENDFEILAVNFDDENLAEMIVDKKLNWKHLAITKEYLQQAIYKKLGFNGIPYYILINTSGEIVKQGYTGDFDFKNDISELIN